MAGTRHHILPRFLLKGFASRAEGDEFFTYTFRAGGSVFESNIKNTAVERHFYGEVGKENADEEITREESEFGHALDTLRLQAEGPITQHSKIVEFIVHLTGRTKHLRDSLIDATDTLVTLMFNRLGDIGFLRQWFRYIYAKDPSFFFSELDRQLISSGMSPLEARAAIDFLQAIMPSVLESLQDEDLIALTPFLQELSQTFRNQLPNAARTGHIQALAKGLVATPRVDEYKSLNWSLVRPADPLILADVGCVFEVADGRRFRSLAGKDDKILNIFLPIASDCMILGSQTDVPRDFRSDKLNREAARISREYFVAHERSQRNSEFQSLLGTDSDIISEEDIRSIVMEAFSIDKLAGG